MKSRKEWLEYFIKELKDKDTKHFEEAGYLNWYHVFGDSDGYEVEEIMRDLLTQDEAEEIWQKSHQGIS